MQSDHSHDTTISEERIDQDMLTQHHMLDSSHDELFDCLENLDSLFWEY